MGTYRITKYLLEKMNIGVMKLKLNSIFPGTTNILVVGIIIAKQYPKVIVSKQGKLITI